MVAITKPSVRGALSPCALHLFHTSLNSNVTLIPTVVQRCQVYPGALEDGAVRCDVISLASVLLAVVPALNSEPAPLPTRPDKACRLGYKVKQGYVILSTLFKGTVVVTNLRCQTEQLMSSLCITVLTSLSLPRAFSLWLSNELDAIVVL